MRYTRRHEHNFEPLCLSGGDYHACASTGFVGCCENQPCGTDSSCNGRALKPMSFDKALYKSVFQDQVCSTGKWYTCANITPPFVGCCKIDPCTSGCPDGDLVEGSLSSNAYDAAPWLNAAKLDSTTDTTSAALAPSSSAATTASSGHKLSGGEISGVAIGVTALGVLLIAALFFYRRRKAATRESIGYETKNPVESSLTGINTASSRGDTASDVHEAPGADVLLKESGSSGYRGDLPMEDLSKNHDELTSWADSNYPSPAPAYSSHQSQNSHSPPQFYEVIELETPVSTFQNFQNHSRQSAELPSPNTLSLLHQHNGGSTTSTSTRRG
ncbi:hypothetical protein MMC29_003350 [Sticta canariensis]|nr:hypothetical protein [Sticta canariensis]